MFTFILQIRQMVEGHPEFYLFAVYSIMIWVLWIIKVVLSARYRPFTGTTPARPASSSPSWTSRSTSSAT